MRYVFVQPSAYGFDNSCMLDAMRELDPAIQRGIIDLDESKTSGKELADLNALGVRGIRVNISPIRKPEAGLAASMLPRIARLTITGKFRLASRLSDAGLAGQRADADAAGVARSSLPWRIWACFRPKMARGKQGFQEFLKLAGDGSRRRTNCRS